MRIFSILLVSFLWATSIPGWETDFEKAKQRATVEHRFILLNFSGSDWCGPCISLRREIFESSLFSDFADNNLVLLNADFPRLKKNQLSKDQQKKNELLADKYNLHGHFPYTVLLDADGKIIHAWDGLPKATSEEFIAQVKALTNVHN
ncbi:MAG: thioredoxin family protein [Chitinophagaceae bacterium]